MSNTIHCQSTREQALALLLERALELASDENELLALMLGYTTLTTDELLTLLGDQNENSY